jgi:hypothetical protein
MISKKIVTPILTMALISGLIFTAAVPVYAQESGTKQENFFVNIFHKLMQTFGFEKSTVQLPGQENSRDNQMNPPEGSPEALPSGTAGQPKDMTKMNEERLSKLVTDGKITETQKAAILAELAIVQSKYSADSMKDLTDTERQTKMKTMQDELKAWAKTQGIDESYVIQAGPQGAGKTQNGTPPTGQRQNGGKQRTEKAPNGSSPDQEAK